MADPTYYGVQPYTFFDSTYYLQQNPDVLASWTESPLDHYIQHGAGEGRAPNAWFSWSAYAALNPDLTAAGVNGALALFEHYNDWGYSEGRITAYNFVNFDSERYLAENPDVVQGGYTLVTAVNHYMEYGEYEGRAAYQTNGSTIVPPVDNLGNTYPLTTGIDTVPAFLGTIYNDTYNASLDNGANTLNPLDNINGLAGIDTLNASIATAVTPAGMSNIEILNATFSGNVALGLTNAAQLTNVNNVGSTTAGIFNNIIAGADLGVNGTNQSTTFNYAVQAGVQTADLTLTNVSGGTQTVTNVETINLVSAGDLNDTTLAGGTTTVNVSGTADLDLNVLAASVTHLHAEGFEGDLLVDVSAQVSNTTATSVHGGLGDDIFVVDNVAIGRGVVASELDGGLGINAIAAAYSADQDVVDAGSITIDNIQIVELTAEDIAGGAVDLDLNAALVGGLEVVEVAGQDANAANVFTVTGLTADQVVAVVETGAVGVTLELGGDTDVTEVNVDLLNGADSAAAFDINQVGTALETVNLTVDANTYTNVDFEAGAGTFTTINIDGGAAGEALTVGASNAIIATTVDATGLDSDLTATFGAAGQSIVGGNGNDTFNFTTNLGTTDTVDGGLGDNTVAFTLGAGLVGPHLTNVQNLDVTTTGASNTISLQNSTGVEVIDIVATAAGTDSATFTNLDDALTDVVVSDSIGTLSVTTAAGELADATLTIGGILTGALTAGTVTMNTRGSLSVESGLDVVARTQTINALNTNATSVTFASQAAAALDATGTGVVTADSATAVTVNAVSANVSVEGANSFDSLNTLAVNATLGAVATFVGTSNTAEANLTIGSVTLTTDNEASTVTNTVSLTASTGAAANLSATLGSLVITNGLDSDITSTTNLTAVGTGAASITSATITNSGDTGDLVDANLNFTAAAAGTASIGTLNVAATAATSEVNVDLDINGAETVVTIGAGALTGAGQIDVTTTDLTALDLSNLDVSGFTGTLSVTGTNAALVNVVGTAYGETIVLAAGAANADVTGGVGADRITLGTSLTDSSSVVYESQADSTGTVYDYVTNFDVDAAATTEDTIDLTALLLGGAAYSGTAANATVTVSGANTTFAITTANAATFFANGVAVAADSTTANSVVFVDANLSGAWEAGSDMAIVLVGVAQANIDAGNFVWV